MTCSIQDALGGEMSEDTFEALCEEPQEAADLYRVYLSRLQWANETSGA
jgi:hypothetical protein